MNESQHKRLKICTTDRASSRETRNRYRACDELGIEPRFRDWDGSGSLVTFVLSVNLYRRHLTSSQKSMIAADVEALLAKETKRGRPKKGDKINTFSEKTRDHAAKLVGTTPSYVTDAKAVKAKDPNLAEKVRTGEVTLPQAKRVMVNWQHGHRTGSYRKRPHGLHSKISASSAP